MSHSKARSKIDQLVEALRPCQPERVYVFGSWARGEQDELSDLDVVVIQQTTLPFFERMREIARLLHQGLLPRPK